MHALIDPSRFVIDSVTMSPRGSYHVRLRSTITVESLGLVRGESTRPLTGKEVRRLAAVSALECWCADDETLALYGLDAPEEPELVVEDDVTFTKDPEPYGEPQITHFDSSEIVDSPSRVALLDRAANVGLKVDGRWGESRLRDEVKKAEEAAAEKAEDEGW